MRWARYDAREGKPTGRKDMNRRIGSVLSASWRAVSVVHEGRSCWDRGMVF